MKKTILTTAIIATLATGFSATAGNHFGKGKGMMGGMGGMHKIIDDIDLTDAQEAQVKEIMKGSSFGGMGNDRAAFMQQRKAHQQEMMTLVRSENLSEEAVNKFVNARAEMMKAKMKSKIIANNKIWNILTPEQQEEANKEMQERTEKMEKRFKKWEKKAAKKQAKAEK